MISVEFNLFKHIKNNLFKHLLLTNIDNRGHRDLQPLLSIETKYINP